MRGISIILRVISLTAICITPMLAVGQDGAPPSSVSAANAGWTPITSDKVASEIELTPALRRVAKNAIAFSFEMHIQLLAPDPAHPTVYFRKGKGEDEHLFIWDYARQCTSLAKRAPSVSAEVILRNARDLEKVLGIVPAGTQTEGVSS